MNRWLALSVAAAATVILPSLLVVMGALPPSSVSPAAPLVVSTTSTTSPRPAWGQSMVYDASDGYTIMFDNGKTWEYQSGVWTLLHTTHTPPGRSWYCLAYDPAAGYVVLFGGGASKDQYLHGIGFAATAVNTTWSFSAGQWKNISKTVGSAPALKYPACAYDPSFDGGAVILMGGANSSYEVRGTWLMNDTNGTWAFVRNLTSGDYHWVPLKPLESPSARFGAGMAFDTRANELVLYGGAQNGTSTANGSCSATVCPHFRDTWNFTGTLSHCTWNLVTNDATDAPPGSVFTAIAYDAADGYIVDFGGQDNGYKSVNATQNQTWAFDGTTWHNITPTGSPGTRFGAAITFDNATGHVLLFAGLGGTVTGSPMRNDFWEFAGGVWTKL